MHRPHRGDQPEVILFDEPASPLDPISTAKIEELIDELSGDYRSRSPPITCGQAARVSRYTAFMYLGEMVEFDETNKVFTSPCVARISLLENPAGGFRKIAKKRDQATRTDTRRLAAQHSQLTLGGNHALHPGPMVENDSALVIAAIARVVRLSTRYAWVVIPAFLIAAVLAGVYVSRHIAINTDSGKLLSSSLPWRQQEMKLNQLFPQRTDLMIAVIDATTPEAADEAADALVNALANRSDVVRTISRPDGGEFFARNGVLFLSVDDVRRDMAQLIKAEPFLGTLAADPTLRGVLGAISQSLEGVRHEKTTLEDHEAGGCRDRRRPRTGRAGRASGLLLAPADLRARAGAIGPSPVRQHPACARLRRSGARRPGDQGHPGDDRETGLTPDRGVTVRLTGSVPLADEEFATIADGAALNGVVTILVVLLILWLALKQARIIFAVLVNLAVGLSFTAAVGLSDGRSAEPHLRRLRRAVHRPWRRLRHPVQRPLPRRAVRGPRSA